MDLATVLLLHKSSFFIGALSFLYVRWQSRRSHGLGILAAAFFLLAIASTLAGFGETRFLPLGVWTLSSFVIGTLGYAVFWVGIRRLSGRQDRPADWLVLAVPAGLAVVALATDFHLVNVPRATVFQFNSIAFLLAAAATLIYDQRHEKLPARFALAAGLVVAAVLALLIVLGLIVPQSVPVNPRSAFFLLILCHFAIALFSLIFVKERTEAALTKLIETDTLTQIHNRHWFFSQLPAAPKTGDAFIIIDIDHFKRINDTFGHAAGDAALVAVAHQMSGHLRQDERLARIGGEEFGIYLPVEAGLQAYTQAEALRAAIETLDIRSGDVRIPVTISAGVTIASSGVTLNEMMSMADAALYSAKNLGRNRVALHQTRAAPAGPTDEPRSAKVPRKRRSLRAS